MTKSASLSRHPWTTSVVWGWRLELQLAALSTVILVVSLSVGPAGPFLVIAIVGSLVARLPKWRERFETRAHLNHAAQQLHLTLLHCGLVNGRGNIPTVFKSSRVAVGSAHLLRLPLGINFDMVEAKASVIAAGLSARNVRVLPNRANAQLIEITIIKRNAFPAILSMPQLQGDRSDLWRRQALGMGEDGRPVTIQIPEHNVLIGGEPGSGKSVALSYFLAMAAMDPEVTITLLDGKQVELAPWAHVSDLFVGPDQGDAVKALHYLQGLMDTRYDLLLAEGTRKISRSSGFGLHLVAIDELAFYLRGGKKELREAFAECLRDLIARGRAAGIIVIAATQKPSHDVVPTWIRDLFAYRLAMRCTSHDASDTILGSGWAQRGYSATSIDPQNRGLGYLLAEGATPTLLKLPFLSDDDIARVVSDALAVRGHCGR